MHNRRQTWVAHLLLPPGLNVLDGRLPNDEPKTAHGPRTFSSIHRRNCTAYYAAAGLDPCLPTHTLIVCSPTLAPKKFLDFLRAVRTFRGRERPFTRNERLSHRGRILGRNVRLQWVVAPQRRWSSDSWVAAGLACGASPHCRWSRDLTAECCRVNEGYESLLSSKGGGLGHVPRSCLCRRRPGEDRVHLRGGRLVGLCRRSAPGALCA